VGVVQSIGGEDGSNRKVLQVVVVVVVVVVVMVMFPVVE